MEEELQPIHIQTNYLYPLFKFFHDEHNLIFTDSQLQDIITNCLIIITEND